MEDGTIMTGKNSPLMHAASSLVLNAIKHLSDIPDKLHLLSPNIVESVAEFKKGIMNARTASLDLDETLTALIISATTNPAAQLASEKLKSCELHITQIPTSGDEAGLRRLGINLTMDPYPSGFFQQFD